MPWKADKNPYKIWLSEVILQQTRVAQGLPYYMKFVSKYPTVIDLANAEEDDVMKDWQGLGYYSRARNMHAAAKFIKSKYNGVFPRDYGKILALPGVGKYTAAAIASFAFDMPYVVVDGNVKRVISRYYGITDPIDSSRTIKHVYELGGELLPQNQAADFNQAIMDFGALHCLPKNPKCSDCPMVIDCVAFRDGLTDTIPFKAKKIIKRIRYFNYLYVSDGYSVLMRQRGKGDIWQGLFDFPLIESQKLLNEQKDELIHPLLTNNQGQISKIRLFGKDTKHLLTHQTLHTRFYHVDIIQKQDFSVSDEYVWIDMEELDSVGKPQLIVNFLKQIQF